jgi:hypothetical protein
MTTHEPLAALLDLDPDLGRLLSDERAREAHAELGVRVSLVPRGLWQADKLASAHPEHVGLLMIDGVLAREVLIADTVSTELLGVGDLVRPWRNGDDASLLAMEVRWTALADVRMAILDRRFASRLVRFPEVNAMLLDRLTDRTQRIAVSQAISQLNGVDRRLLALFWHLAERWGRMTSLGIVVPMTLSHRVLAQLVGARRPTVSTALGELADRGEVIRRDDGTWLLAGEPVSGPSAEVERIVEHRRRLLPTDRPDEPEPAPMPVPRTDDPVFRVKDMAQRIEHLRASGALQMQQLKESRDAATELIQHADSLRRRREDVRVNGRQG